jgi:uncharacterized protein (DUF2147 family)
MALIGGAALAEDASPGGFWVTEGGESHIEIRQCGAYLCGTIVWMKEPLDGTGQPKTDRLNPDPIARARPLLGLEILSNFAPAAEPGQWEEGLIYSPRDGHVYRANLTLIDVDRLEVRGYIGLPLFGSSQIWQRVGVGVTDAKP